MNDDDYRYRSTESEAVYTMVSSVHTESDAIIVHYRKLLCQ